MHTEFAHNPVAALRSLCHLPAATFGNLLLARTKGHRHIAFREFVRTARDMVEGDPETAATWLAALIAIDMRTQDAGSRPAPSTN